MPKKIISLDELSRFKSKVDTLLSNKADKEGFLPHFDCYTGTETPLQFIQRIGITQYGFGQPFALLTDGVGSGIRSFVGLFRSYNGGEDNRYSFEFEETATNERYIGTGVDLTNATWNDIFSSTYSRPLEEQANKVTTLSNSSTNNQYPSAKCVYDNLQNVREVAEGKCKCFVVSYNETEPTENNFIADRWKDADGNPFFTWSALSTYISGYNFGNDLFNSQNNSIDVSGTYLIDYYTKNIYKIDENMPIKVGDVFLVAETSVPDRWSNGGDYMLTLESTTLDPSGYVDDHTIAQAYSNQLTYAVGDLVIYDHKLYRCSTAVSSAEDFDSTKWVVATVSDTFVDLYRNQTISGQKTFSDKIIFTTSSNYNFIEQGNFYIGRDGNNGVELGISNYGFKFYSGNVRVNSPLLIPQNDNTTDVGSSSSRIKDLHLSGTAYLPIIEDSTAISFKINGIERFKLNGADAITGRLYPSYYNTFDVGTSSLKYKDLYLAGSINLGTSGVLKYENSTFIFNDDVLPAVTDNYDLGSSSVKWRDLYLSRNLTDGTNSVSLADLAALIAYAKGQGWIQ